jgi:hypothetical protein
VQEEAGYFQRNHWVPVPEAEDLAALNGRLLKACQQDEHRTIAGHEQTTGACLLVERDHLLPLMEGFDLGQVSFPTVKWIRLREGADQCVFGAAVGRGSGAGEGLRRDSRAVARRGRGR